VRQTLFTEVLPMEELRFEKRNAILDEQHEFLDSIRTGRPPRVSGEQARDCLAVAERILACIAAGDMRPGHRRDRAEEPARTIAPPLWQTIPARRMAG
jgi:predicted dehydrogenase